MRALPNLEGSKDSPLLSIVVPTYNIVGKLAACLASLCELRVEGGFEVIFVDDGSSDGTFERLRTEADGHSNWYVHQLEANTGSPSKPRNVGLNRATGRYVMFLDGDDAIDGLGTTLALRRADEESLDCVRGPVRLNIVGQRSFVIDRLPVESWSLTGTELVAALATHQSLTCTAVFRRASLRQLNAAFDENVRMGEDITFVAEVITQTDRIGYVDHPLFTYMKYPGASSAMSMIGSREVAELAKSWQRVETCFEQLGLSYIELHGKSTIAYAIKQLIRYKSERISEDAFRAIAAFVSENWTKIEELEFSERVWEVIRTLREGNHEDFLGVIKPRLLIAGHDLKFIRSAEPELAELYSIRYDEWPSERIHDPVASAELLEWADYVWCEWLAACAVWYSERVTGDKRMVTRLHRYELGRDYGDRLVRENVDAVIAIAPHCYEDAVDRFRFDRSKVRYVPNYYRVDDYQRAEDDEFRVFRLAMIGNVPRRKGFLRSLELLAHLRKTDPRYTLDILGKGPSEYPWVAGDPEENAYYLACEEYIEEQGLKPYVKYLGWSDTREKAKDYGFVLSMSDHEGSHVGPGEAFIAGNQGVFLPWRGVEYIYPKRYVFEGIEAMAEYVLQNRDITVFERNARFGERFMRQTYGINQFVARVDALWKSV